MPLQETKTATSLKELRALIEPILKKHDVLHASVFGSVAAGTAGPDSDLDLLIEFPPGAGKSLLDVIGLQQELEAVLERKVDIGFSHTLRPRLRGRILSEKIAIL